MKLPLVTGVLSAALLAGCAGAAGGTKGTAGHYVLRVDRTFDRSAQPVRPSDDLPAGSYRSAPASDRWEVSVEGSTVLLTPLANPAEPRLEGREIPAGVPGERRFEIERGAFAGGRFVIRGDEGELTMYGSGVPIVSSERGLLVTH